MRGVGASHRRGRGPDWTPEAESNTWIACTDADSAVPATWLTQQCAFANAGMDVVVGTVEPREGDLSTDVLAAWIARHSLVEGHEHIHGANLGFTLAAYLAVGGFLAMPTHEDVHLVARLRAQGHPHVATDSTRVITSGRRVSRTTGGLASHLNNLPMIDGPATVTRDRPSRERSVRSA